MSDAPDNNNDKKQPGDNNYKGLTGLPEDTVLANQITSDPCEPKWKFVQINPQQENRGLPPFTGHGKSANDTSLMSVDTPYLGKTAAAASSSIFDYDAKKPSAIVKEVSPWTVEHENLRTLPKWYRFEQTTIYVESTNASLVSERIVKVNKEMSVQAKYSNEQNNAILITPDLVEISVNLYKKPSNSDGVIVEVQRVFGCSVLFHRYCKSILLAASGELDYAELQGIISPNLSLPESRYASSISNEEKLESKIPPKSDIGDTSSLGFAPSYSDIEMESLITTSSLLLKESFDAQNLGIECLGHLTDANKTNSRALLISSKAVLLNDDERFAPLRQKIINLLKSHAHTGKEEGEISSCTSSSLSAGGNTHAFVSEHDSFMHNRALLVYSNALSVIVSRGTREEIQNAIENVQAGDLLPHFVLLVKHALKHPHEAHLAAKCIRILLGYSPGMSTQAQKNKNALVAALDLVSVVENANEVGRKFHLALAEECHDILTQI